MEENKNKEMAEPEVQQNDTLPTAEQSAEQVEEQPVVKSEEVAAPAESAPAATPVESAPAAAESTPAVPAVPAKVKAKKSKKLKSMTLKN